MTIDMTPDELDRLADRLSKQANATPVASDHDPVDHSAHHCTVEQCGDTQ
jgi:hypothetical protein